MRRFEDGLLAAARVLLLALFVLVILFGIAYVVKVAVEMLGGK